ncbi:MAG: Grx4 family monothiol glutaredoxin [Pseudomonadota bacterium]
MTLSISTKERIESIISTDRVVLFMKGNRTQPQCGFSAATVGILDSLVSDYTTFDVLSDAEIREGIKAYSDWPTIPQLYVDQEFLGGCDIVREMFNAGELHDTFGLAPPDRTPPTIILTDEAATLINAAREGQPELCVHLSIDAQWNHEFSLGPAAGHELKTTANGVTFLVDLQTAPLANGLHIGAVESPQGRNLSVTNPNMPAAVKQLSVQELARWLEEKREFELIDVRTEEEIRTASIERARMFDEPYFNAIHGMSRDVPLVFLCHHGNRSQAAAEQFRSLGFTEILNVTGGIDAWSRDIDSTVPRY